ncbi:hypothetical protein EVAR_19676_1 [Eumeta japonica]|uniref:Uncharacterized protein n=1 Tax=Eumeta variegata TaxID=151549 RepID=A0A4C1V445_EUMVA|nr:hypothetical protein EVAR_19676_1 [Eumeta japonica]
MFLRCRCVWSAQITSKSTSITPVRTSSAAVLTVLYAFVNIINDSLCVLRRALRTMCKNSRSYQHPTAYITVATAVALDTDQIDSPPILIVSDLCSLPFTVMVYDLAGENFSWLRPSRSRIRCKAARDRLSISARVYASTRIVMASGYAITWTLIAFQTRLTILELMPSNPGAVFGKSLTKPCIYRRVRGSASAPKAQKLPSREQNGVCIFARIMGVVDIPSAAPLI